MATPPQESKPDKRRKYDDAFKAEALRLAQESRSARAAARQLGISERMLYRWRDQQAAAELGSAELARDLEVRATRRVAASAAQAGHPKKSLAIFNQETP